MRFRNRSAGLVLPLLILGSSMSPLHAEAWSPNPLPGTIERLLPGYRPLRGDSLAAGDRSLLQTNALTGADPGEPNRIVSHLPFDDVDGDGTDDILELDLDLTEAHPNYGFMGVLRLTTLSGDHGSPLGRYDFDFHSGVPMVLPARVGRHGKPGVVILLDRFISNADNPTYKLEAHAVTAKGNLVWSREWVSTSTSTPTRFVAATNVAIPIGLYDGLPGRASDLLVALFDYSGAVISTTPIVVDGTDGTERRQDPIPVPWIASPPVPIPAPDLDRDGNDDVLITSTDGLGNGLLARSSVSGDDLWHNEGVPSGRGLNTADLGDVTGDDARDLALGAPVRLIDGGTGAAVWENPGGAYVIRQGDVDHDGEPDVLAEGFLAEDERFGARFELVNSKGQTLAKNTLGVRRDGNGFSWIITEEAGDPDVDGLPDEALHLLHYPSEGKPTERRFIISGADVSVLHRGPQMIPLGGSISRDGDDLLVAHDLSWGGRFTALDGRSGQPLWTERVKVPKKMELAFHPRAVATRAGEADIIATFYDRRSSYAVLLDGRTGHPRWFRRLASS